MTSPRQKGLNFERRVREDLNKRGWFVSKFMNNVDLEQDKMVPAKQGRFRLTSTGLPDFICWKRKRCNACENIFIENLHNNIIGVECKSLGYLNKEEKAKIQWYLKRKVFEEVYVAKKGKKRGVIEYDVCEETK